MARKIKSRTKSIGLEFNIDFGAELFEYAYTKVGKMEIGSDLSGKATVDTGITQGVGKNGIRGEIVLTRWQYDV